MATRFKPETQMPDRMVPLIDAKPRVAPLTIRIAEVPSLFSEGPEPETANQAAARWADFARVALRLLNQPRPVRDSASRSSAIRR